VDPYVHSSMRLHGVGLISLSTGTTLPFTSQETHYFTVTTTNRLMLFRETVAVYCENRMEHINTLCGQNVRF
jgi:hypothetical protein